MDRLRDWALRLIIALNVIALVVSSGESFAGLYQWAQHHSINGWAAAVFPLMIDVMILVGEAGLFVAHHGRWRVRDKAWMWFVTLTALGVSAAANIGHVISTDWLSHLTAALPPVALFFSMTVGFGVMKRVYLNKKTEPVITPPPARASITETIPSAISENLAELRTETSQALAENLAEILTETPPASETSHPSLSLAPSLPESLDPTETFAGPPVIVTAKSYSQPRDTREGLTLTEMRVRDMYDLDPDISASTVETSLGVSRASAYRYLKATKEARGQAA